MAEEYYCSNCDEYVTLGHECHRLQKITDSQQSNLSKEGEYIDECEFCSLWRLDKANYCPNCGNYLKHQNILTKIGILVEKLKETKNEIQDKLNNEDIVDMERVIYRLENIASDVIVDKDIEDISEKIIEKENNYVFRNKS